MAASSSKRNKEGSDGASQEREKLIRRQELELFEKMSRPPDAKDWTNLLKRRNEIKNNPVDEEKEDEDEEDEDNGTSPRSPTSKRLRSE